MTNTYGTPEAIGDRAIDAENRRWTDNPEALEAWADEQHARLVASRLCWALAPGAMMRKRDEWIDAFRAAAAQDGAWDTMMPWAANR